MIAFLRGRIAYKGPDHCLLDVHGVGYRLALSTSSVSALPPEDEEVTLLTYLQAREDAVALFGFMHEDERRLFELLISVSQVGPKVALAALSTLTPDALKDAVAREDAAAIARTPGIGKKTAQRIIVELADKLEVPEFAVSTDIPSDTMAEATEALQGMGFSGAEIAEAVSDLDAEGDVSAEAVVRHALKRLGGR